MRSLWLTRHERPYFCCEFSRFGRDVRTAREPLAAEILAAQEVIQSQPPRSLPVAVDLYAVPMTPELAAFFCAIADDADTPVLRLALIGLTSWQSRWYRLRYGVRWPRCARRLADWELAKEWLVTGRG